MEIGDQVNTKHSFSTSDSFILSDTIYSINYDKSTTDPHSTHGRNDPNNNNNNWDRKKIGKTIAPLFTFYLPRISLMGEIYHSRLATSTICFCYSSIQMHLPIVQIPIVQIQKMIQDWHILVSNILKSQRSCFCQR